MKVLSVNLARVRSLDWQGRSFETGIYKEPAAGPVAVGPDGLAGDRQLDRRFHGGAFKAVYAYSAEDLAWWSKELGATLAPGTFGENLTLEGWSEAEVCVGDRFRMGTAVLEAVQPRQPCMTLAARMGDAGFVKRFAAAARWGVYFRVAEAGRVAAGDAVERVHADPVRFSIPRLAALLLKKPAPAGEAAAAAALTALPPELRARLAGA